MLSEFIFMKKTNTAITYPLLIIDDDPDIIRYCSAVLQKNGIHKIEKVTNPQKIDFMLTAANYEVILLDLKIPQTSGEKILKTIRQQQPDIPVIIITGKNDVQKAVECLQAGAFDYIVKPADKNRLLNSVNKAVELREVKLENKNLKKSMLSCRKKLKHPGIFKKIITDDPQMFSIFKYIETVSLSTQPILITGATGVGKELIAEAIYKHSNLKGKFVPINTAGLDSNTFSDTLFGHTKGAFTGASQNRQGIINQAQNGMLFLDEIGDLSPALQIKLLRLIEEKEYFPLGSDQPIPTNARIIVATNRKINDIENNTNFRKDLYYRLCIHHIDIPPLKERPQDIPLLVKHFSHRIARELEKPVPHIGNTVMQFLKSYYYPGNVRELQGILFDAVSRSENNRLTLTQVRNIILQKNKAFKQKPAVQKSSAGRGADRDNIIFPEKLPGLKEMEKVLIEATLKKNNYNQSRAARSLGISRQALNKRLQQK